MEKHPSTMHIVYGISIIILAVVVTGLVCVIANLPVPYFSKFYAPVTVPLSVGTFVHHQMPVSTSSSPTTSTAP